VDFQLPYKGLYKITTTINYPHNSNFIISQKHRSLLVSVMFFAVLSLYFSKTSDFDQKSKKNPLCAVFQNQFSSHSFIAKS